MDEHGSEDNLVNDVVAIVHHYQAELRRLISPAHANCGRLPLGHPDHTGTDGRCLVPRGRPVPARQFIGGE